MSLIVQKFGGSSVADAASIKRVANRVVSYTKAGHQVAVVVSAMGDSTDELIDLSRQVSPMPPKREMDLLLTSGERISAALLAMAIGTLDSEARSFTGEQAGFITDKNHGVARIKTVQPDRIREALNQGAVAVIAGFQGISDETGDITTLGRGGSDTTAVALAVALGADVCEIYTDVDGVFTADPRIVPAAQRIPVISSDEMLEMAASGAKILHLRCVEYAQRFEMPIHVRSSFSTNIGTIICDNPSAHFPITATKYFDTHTDIVLGSTEEAKVEEPIISGVTHDRSEAKVTVVGVPDTPGNAAKIFEVMAGTGANVDMIVQNISVGEPGRANISFTLPMTDGQRAVETLNSRKDELGFQKLMYNDQIGKLSLIGAGMRSHPGVTATLFKALSEAEINISMISTSEIRISVVTAADDLDAAVRAAHTAFGLDSQNGEAVVYGGTGR